jgi:hypothetical protein
MAPTTIAKKKLLLAKIYKKTLSTPQKLLVEARKTIPSMKIADVQGFLHEQPDYLRTTKVSYKRYPRSLVRRHIVIAEPFQELFMDTWYLKRNISAHFCFVIICGFTKYLWVRFSRVLNAAAAAKAIKSVIDPLHSSDETVLEVATDRGPEFKAEFSRYLTSNGIKQIFMTGPNKTVIGERIIR